MNRRDALKKLSVGGAIAAGGSMVLSSTNVAYAASTGTAPTGTIQTVSVLGSAWTVELQLGSSTWVEQSRTWSYSVVSLSPANSGTSSGAASATNFQLSKLNNGGNPANWKPGDRIAFSVTVVFDCGTVSYGPTTLTV